MGGTHGGALYLSKEHPYVGALLRAPEPIRMHVKVCTYLYARPWGAWALQSLARASRSYLRRSELGFDAVLGQEVVEEVPGVDGVPPLAGPIGNVARRSFDMFLICGEIYDLISCGIATLLGLFDFARSCSI